MFKRHPTSKLAMLAYLIWWVLFYLIALGNSNDRKFDLFLKLTFVIVLVYFIVFIVKTFTAEGINRKDFSKMLWLVLLPILLPILAFIIYLLFGGKILTKLW